MRVYTTLHSRKSYVPSINKKGIRGDPPVFDDLQTNIYDQFSLIGTDVESETVNDFTFDGKQYKVSKLPPYDLNDPKGKNPNTIMGVENIGVLTKWLVLTRASEKANDFIVFLEKEGNANDNKAIHFHYDIKAISDNEQMEVMWFEVRGNNCNYRSQEYCLNSEINDPYLYLIEKLDFKSKTHAIFDFSTNNGFYKNVYLTLVDVPFLNCMNWGSVPKRRIAGFALPQEGQN